MKYVHGMGWAAVLLLLAAAVAGLRPDGRQAESAAGPDAVAASLASAGREPAEAPPSQRNGLISLLVGGEPHERAWAGTDPAAARARLVVLNPELLKPRPDVRAGDRLQGWAVGRGAQYYVYALGEFATVAPV